MTVMRISDTKKETWRHRPVAAVGLCGAGRGSTATRVLPLRPPLLLLQAGLPGRQPRFPVRQDSGITLCSFTLLPFACGALFAPQAEKFFLGHESPFARL
jgi:hypothetical protein